MNHELIATVISGALVIGFWWLLFFEGRQYWVDRTRQRLFNIRDNLFDRAAAGEGITFDDAAYGITRTTLNGMIQFSHNIGLARLLSIFVVYRDSRRRELVRQYNEEFHSAIEGLSKEGRVMVLRTIAEMHLVTLNHVIHTSVLLWPVFAPMILILRITRRLNKVRRWALRGKRRRQPWSILDTAANKMGAVNPA